MLQAKSLKSKIPIAVLIGGGSKLPAILKAAKSPTSKFKITLVISHKKQSDGINLALKNNIPASYFNLVDWKKRNESSRAGYMHYLGWFISQPVYSPELLVFAGWDLVMDANFFKFFKCKFGEGFAAINLHPALLPKTDESIIRLPDGTSSQVIKGEQEEVLRTVIKKRLTYFGPSVHFMVPTKYDTGKVIKRDFIKVSPNDILETLRKKLMPAEDKILVESINEVIDRYLTVNNEG